MKKYILEENIKLKTMFWKILALYLFASLVQAELPSDFCDGKPFWNSHPTDCTKFIRCWNGKAYISTCTGGLYWDNTARVCNYPEHVSCHVGTTTTTTSSGPTTTTTSSTVVPDTTSTTTITSGIPYTTHTRTTTTQHIPKTTTDSTTETCTLSNCNLSGGKDCWCIGENTPGGLPNLETPKLILISFDDAVSRLNFPTYMELFDGRNNPNGCPISTTYFVSDNYTDYRDVRELFHKGHEIAVHTLTHRTPADWWKDASYDDLVAEIVGMKDKLESEGITNVKGFRNPFLQTAGNRTFQVLQDNGFLYDSTLPVHFGKQWWPYTFNYGGPSSSECVIQPCPTKSFPGLWEVPMLQMKDTVAVCSMFDSCYRYKSNTIDGVFDFFMTNFNRHYKCNTAPFPLFTHASWMLHPAFAYRKEGFRKFLNYLKDRDDVYIVNLQQTIEWMRNPTRLADIKEHFGPLSC